MKRTLSIVSLVLFVMAQGLTACAEATPRQTLTSGNFRYILQDDDTAIITGYFGNDEKLSIPNQLAGHTVVAIGDEAFFDCDNLTSVYIPNGVTEIGDAAFWNCDSFISVFIPNSVIRYIGRWKGMKSYEVELDQNGFVLRCEEMDSVSTEEKPKNTGESNEFVPAPTPTPLPDGKPWFWEMDFAPQEFWDQLDKLFFTHVMTMDDYPAMEKDWLEAFGESELFWPQEYQIVRYLYYASEEQLKQPGLQYPVFPDQDRKSQKEIGEIALSAFHEIADAQMGKEWVDSIKVGSVLWNDKINPDTGEKYEKHVWSIWFLVWEDEFNVWNPKGEAILDEDGNVLVIRLELSGNG